MLASARQRQQVQQKDVAFRDGVGEKTAIQGRVAGGESQAVEGNKEGTSAADVPQSGKAGQADLPAEEKGSEASGILRTPFRGHAAESSESVMLKVEAPRSAIRSENEIAVVRNLVDMYRACTNGYFKYLEGRCNAVVQPVGDDLF